MNQPSTPPHVVLVVVYALAGLAALGFIGTFILVERKLDGSAIAVFSGLTGTVLGGLMSTLNNTRTSPPTESQGSSVTVETTTTDKIPEVTAPITPPVKP